MKRKPVETRFWNHVKKTDDCWLWTGSTNARYGILRYDGRAIDAHRLSWILANGAAPDGLCVRHSCANRACVRPDHLFLGKPLVKPKLEREAVLAIRADLQRGETVKGTARKYGLCPHSIRDIRDGVSWGWL